MISGIILSAGALSLSGIPPSLQRADTEIFLRRIVTVLHSARITDIAVVLDDDYMQICADISGDEEKIVFIRQPESGETASIRAGVAGISGADVHGVMICPIDRPLITQKLLVNLLQAFWHSQKNIIIPTCNGKRGYPVIFGAKLFNLLQTENGIGVIRNHTNEILEAESDENASIISVSSMEEYKKYSGENKND